MKFYLEFIVRFYLEFILSIYLEFILMTTVSGRIPGEVQNLGVDPDGVMYLHRPSTPHSGAHLNFTTILSITQKDYALNFQQISFYCSMQKCFCNIYIYHSYINIHL